MEEYLRTGEVANGLSLLAEGLEPEHEVYLYEPELYRLKGEMLLVQDSDNAIEAERCFRTAVNMSQGQGTKSLELPRDDQPCRTIRFSTPPVIQTGDTKKFAGF